eukprot:TRINITY_DN14902_c0_g1_i1.p1 TRINITY_DN14902_c0_g1~~TRINITY_DN14902_c0_g1_i1.p1  ORF type:complete len:480 (+),score=78.02 TRINITY_DN14902_c0_g1_i1:88-1440(+)
MAWDGRNSSNLGWWSNSSEKWSWRGEDSVKVDWISESGESSKDAGKIQTWSSSCQSGCSSSSTSSSLRRMPEVSGHSRSLRGSSIRRGNLADRVKRQLTQCEADQILKVSSSCGEQMDVASAVVALQRLARDSSFKSNGKDRRIEGILQSLRKQILSGSGFTDQRQFINSSWALARLQVTDTLILDALTAEFLSPSTELSCQDLCCVSWAFSRLEVVGSTVTEKFYQNAEEKLHAFNPSQLSSLSCLAARAQEVGEPLMKMISSRSQQLLSEFSPRDLSHVAWAVASLQMDDVNDFMEQVAKEACVKACEACSLDFANTAWSFAQLSLNSSEVYAEAVVREVKRKIPDLNSQEMGYWMWAFSKASLETDSVIEIITQSSWSKVDSMTSQELCNLLWVFSKRPVDSLDGELIDALAARTVVLAHEFSTQELAQASSAFELSKLGCAVLHLT